jgi:hypothetical protein
MSPSTNGPSGQITMAERQIVEYDSIVDCRRKRVGAVAADIAGAAGDKP